MADFIQKLIDNIPDYQQFVNVGRALFGPNLEDSSFFLQIRCIFTTNVVYCTVEKAVKSWKERPFYGAAREHS